MANFFCLRMGQCLKLMCKADAARKCLLPVHDADSHIVRAWACYELASMDLAEGQYLQARSRAYAALAAARCANAAAALESDCDFLIGKAMTQKMSTDAASISWRDPARANQFDALGVALGERSLAEG